MVGTWVASYLRRIARVRQSERRINISLQSPATLSLDVNYSTSVILDSILASALVMEKKREDAEEHRSPTFYYLPRAAMHDDHPKHTSNKKRLSLYYYASRLIVASFIVLAATIFPPFDASHLITQPDRKFGLTSALLRWDVFHFSNVAINGYTHEHLFAFFPGTPGLMKAVAETGLMLGRTLGSTERKQIGEGDVLLGGALASLVLCDWTGDLYDLTIAVGGTPSMAKLTALLSLVPLSPPTLLFAPYAEPFFARLSYKGILACHRRQWLKATFCFMLATSFRSNGTLLAGFIAWGMCAEPLIRRAAEGKKLLNKNLIVSSLLAILSTVIILLPFILHQTHGYIAFCTNSTTTPAAWCTSKPFPLIYSYVQKEYWD
ncbi:ER membrane glycoprotein subunit of the GPI transamidase complex-like protein, partial [Tulasnella sp. 427]